MVLIGIVIGLLIGSGVVYIYGQSQIAGYKQAIERLEMENLGIMEEKAQLLEECAALQDQLDDIRENLSSTKQSLQNLQEEYDNLQIDFDHILEELEKAEEEYEELNNSYVCLLDTLGFIDAKNYSRTDKFNLTAGQAKTFTYDIGHGIIWEIDISFDGRRGWVSIFWRRGSQGGVITSGCDTLTERLPYVSGTAKTKVYEDGDMIFIITSVMVTEFPSMSRTGDGRFQIEWTPPSPTIDGVAMLGEWPEFQDLRLEYWKTYKYGKTAGAEPWDTHDKISQVSAIRDISNLYLCLKVPDDYVNDEYRIDGLDVYIVNPPVEKHIRWDKSEIWITDELGEAKYTYEDDAYIIELKIPIGFFSVDDLEIEVKYLEVTRYTIKGTFEESSYWVSDPFEVPFKLEVVITDVPGIINGEFTTSTEGRPWDPEGWDLQGSGWMNRLSQYERGTDLIQTTKLDFPAEGIAFWVKPQPKGGEVGLEFSINGVVLYSDSYSGPDYYFESFRVIISLEQLDYQPDGLYEIRFHVPPGPKTGAHVVIDNVTFVEFN